MNLADAIRRAPGIYIQEFTGRQTQVYIRGYNSDQIGYYIDGIPMNVIFNDGTNDMDFFHTQSFSGVQISKGFTSPLYSQSLGGAINMVTAKPQKELEIHLYQKHYYGRGSGASPQQIDQGIGIGTNQGKYYFQAEVSRVGRETIPLSYNYKDTVEAEYGYKSTRYENKWVRLTAGWRPNENHEYSLNYIRQYAEKHSITRSNTSASSIPDDASQYATVRNAIWLNKDMIYLLGKTYFMPTLSLNSRLYYQKQNESIIWSYPGTSDYDDYAIGGIFDVNWDIAEKTNLKVGVNEKFDKHIRMNYDDYTSKTTGTKAHDDGELKTSIFAQFAQGLGDFRFVLSGSYDRMDTTQKNFYSGTWYPKMSSIGGYTVQSAVYYDFTQGNSLHLNIGRKQSYPAMRDRMYSTNAIPNHDLEPESAINYEVGYDLRMKSGLGTTFVSTAAYFNDMKKMFSSEYHYFETLDAALAADCQLPSVRSDGTYRCSRMINMDFGYTYGGEIAAEQGFWDDKFVLGVNYSFIQKFAKGDSSDNKTAGHKITDYANHQLNGKVALHPSKDLDIVALWTYHSAPWYQTYTRWRDENNAWVYNYYYVRGRAYITVDLSVNYEIGKGLSVNAAAYNLIDRSNWLGSGTSYYVQPERRFVVGLDYKY